LAGARFSPLRAPREFAPDLVLMRRRATGKRHIGEPFGFDQQAGHSRHEERPNGQKPEQAR
jgi:hypothetical protein